MIRRFSVVAGMLMICCLILAQNGYHAIWEIDVKGSKDKPIREEVTICGSHMRIDRGDGSTFLFDSDREQAVLLHEGTNHAWRFSFERNRSFFQRFLIPYGIITENGVMLFPETIFRRTGRKATKNGIMCEEVQLPGEFLNSRTIAWYPVKALESGSEMVRAYFSFLTRNRNFLQQVERLTGFPVVMEMRVRVNGAAVVTTRTLLSTGLIDCSELSFDLPDGTQVEDIPGAGVPLMQR